MYNYNYLNLFDYEIANTLELKLKYLTYCMLYFLLK